MKLPGLVSLVMLLTGCSALLDLPSDEASAESGPRAGSTAPAHLSGLAEDAAVSLTWDASAGAVGYRVYWRQEGQEERSTWVPAERLNERVEGLVNGVVHVFEVTALGAGNQESARSAPLRLTPLDAQEVFKVQQTVPASGEEQVVRDGAWVIAFSAPVDRASFSIQLTPSVPLQPAEWLLWDTVAIVKPSAPLEPKTSYSAVVSATSTRGLSLSGPNVPWTFVTAEEGRAATALPSLIQTTPAVGAKEVTSGTDVLLRFSRPMDVASVDVWTTPPARLGRPTWDDTRMTLLFPDSSAALRGNRLYTVQVIGKDATGNPLGGATRFFFVTAASSDTAAPSVVFRSPRPDQENVSPEAIVTFRFSEPMRRPETEAAFRSQPELGCVFLWSADSTRLACHPRRPLQPRTSYEVTLAPTAMDEAGNALGTPERLLFTTAQTRETDGPGVSEVLPVKFATEVNPDAVIRLTFSEPMRPSRTEEAFHLLQPLSLSAGSFSWNEAGTELTFVSPKPFPLGTEVIWQLDTTAKDLGGNPVSPSQTGRFAVRHCQMAPEIRTRFEALAGVDTTGRCLMDTAQLSDGGLYVDFEKGTLIHKKDVGTFWLFGEIRSKWLTTGGALGLHKYPISDAAPSMDNEGLFARFQFGVIAWSPRTGAHGVQGAILVKWTELGREAGQLGYPISDEYAIPGGRRSDFENGSLSWDSATKAVTVRYTR